MKRIKFTELGFKKSLDTFIVSIGIICLIIGLVALFGYPESKLSALAGFSVVLTTFPQMKTFFYKNHFVWNKKGGTFKINSKRKVIVFSDIESFHLDENKLNICKKNKVEIDFNLQEIDKEDINKLKEILENHFRKSF